LEGSTTTEKPVAESLSTIPETKNESRTQLVAPKQKAIPLFSTLSMKELNYINVNIL